jgi:histidinol-phosphate aminotransferase
VDAIAKYAADGNRYDPDDLKDKLTSIIAMKEGVPESTVRVWPGSGGPLVSIVAAYCSPGKGLVTVNPTFESAWRTAAYLGAPLAMAPQAIGQGADVKAMLAANPNAGLYYICTPNNPTGTVTRWPTSSGCWTTSPQGPWCWSTKPISTSRRLLRR